MSDEKRENALCGIVLVLGAQMSGGCVTIIDYLSEFCERIENYNLKPWGKKGREYLDGGVEELIVTGAYDSLIVCEGCHKSFLTKLDSHTVDLFLKDWKDEIGYEEWVKCNDCGGSIEKENGGE